jgi:hypothetical protein
MDKSTLREISSDLIAEADGAQYFLRLVESGNGSTKQPLKRKFGVSRYWYCEKARSWLPAKKGHIYLPVDLWAPFQQALARTHYRVVTACADGNGHSSSIDGGNKNPPTGADIATGNVTTATATTCTAAAAAAATAVAAKRKRGRPPKCMRVEPADTARHGRHECNTEESGPDSCEGDEAVQRGSDAAEDPAHEEAAKSVQVVADASGADASGNDGGYTSGNCDTTAA